MFAVLDLNKLRCHFYPLKSLDAHVHDLSTIHVDSNEFERLSKQCHIIDIVSIYNDNKMTVLDVLVHLALQCPHTETASEIELLSLSLSDHESCFTISLYFKQCFDLIESNILRF